MRFERSLFTGGRVVLDGNEYIDCTFDRSQVVFSATAPVALKGCVFRDVQWALDGPAALTVEFLRGLYHSMGPAGVDLVEQLFANVRKPPTGIASVSSNTQVSGIAVPGSHVAGQR